LQQVTVWSLDAHSVFYFGQLSHERFCERRRSYCRVNIKFGQTGSDAEDIFIVAVELVVAQLIQDPQEDKDRAGHLYTQTENVNE
jgi:hypothetical protein